MSAAIESDTNQDNGLVTFFDAQGNVQIKFEVGALLYIEPPAPPIAERFWWPMKVRPRMIGM